MVEHSEELTDEEFANISELDMIKAMALKNNISIDDPNPKCKKCYGRGYRGKHANTGAPVPCSCLFRNQEKNPFNEVKDFKHMSRKEIRSNPTYMKFYKELRTNERVKKLQELKDNAGQ